jgi:hypothetical protein
MRTPGGRPLARGPSLEPSPLSPPDIAKSRVAKALFAIGLSDSDFGTLVRARMIDL